MRFFPVEGRIGGGLPGPDPLGREPFPPQKPPDPLIGDRRQESTLPAILGLARVAMSPRPPGSSHPVPGRGVIL